MYGIIRAIAIDLGACVVGYGVTKLSLTAIDKIKEAMVMKKKNAKTATVFDAYTGDVVEVNVEDIDNIIFFDELKYAKTV
nr:MAG TPA: hypothetical protein [Caudoviricetes sp.]